MEFALLRAMSEYKNNTKKRNDGFWEAKVWEERRM